MALPTRVSRAQQSDPFADAQREFDTMLNRFFGGPQTARGQRLAPYAVDVREDGDHLYVEAELPGFKKDEVDVGLEDGTLTITAERKAETERKGDLLLHERRYTHFQRSFALPKTVDESTCDAKLDAGILTVTLNKREETKPRKVEVK